MGERYYYYLWKVWILIIIIKSYWMIGSYAKNFILAGNDDDEDLNVNFSSYNYYTLDRPRLLFSNSLIMHSLACK